MAPLVVGGASRGFSVLLIGGVVQPWVGQLLPALGYVWLLLVALAAFAWAARPRAVSGAQPPALRLDRAVVGTAAALGSYALVLPLVLSVADAVPWTQLLLTSLTALTVGALVGGLAPAPRTA
ncbi:MULTISPECIES: hypothetical protein [unclassified Nocardioides]|uniref:hypothetical protein n=1 Tax=unclassified Nocardioides TaxID=2615069 RepID=UPI0007036B1F|nr:MULTISPECIES: hypothetical protein [unclassified Nocardioides]KRC54173.1 hypothetical protein ASE19_08985 [Nocardioides sp. Root79]KRC71509.1 hypothetical protein ASE20_11400 [Nocardioides sp. Root240]